MTLSVSSIFTRAMITVMLALMVLMDFGGMPRRGAPFVL